MKNKMVRRSAAVIPLLMMPALAEPATFTPIGAELPPGDFMLNDVSADGSVITGYLPGIPSRAFRWTAATGFVGLGSVLPSETSIGRAISDDGNTIVGLSNGEAFRWTPAGGMVGLGNLNEFSEGATGVSADGQVVVGIIGGQSSAAIWSGGSITLLDPLPTGSSSAAFGVSGDGQVVVGRSSRELEVEGPVNEATRWVNGVPAGLGDLPGWDYWSRAEAASADGSVIVGWSRAAYSIDGGEGEIELEAAFRWTPVGGMVALDSQFANSRALDVSADGNVIVGNREGTGATVWINGGEGQSLFDLLVAQGATGLDGWSLGATAISADGRTIIGMGYGPDPNVQLGWVATIDTAVVPAPPAFALLASAVGALAGWTWRKSSGRP
ncbi:MAG: hypothetical protein JNK40_05110 [Chromatiales bacterium]|nr:hypothetical protein [Chromatiales bacterium]